MSFRDNRLMAASNRVLVERLYRRIVSVVFGDGIGIALFLGALVFFGLYWRVGFFISDNWTIANTLRAVADGHLHIDALAYGRPDNQPGTHVVDGRLYGRNYGHVFYALGFLLALKASALIVDPRILIASGWSLLVLAFAVQVGKLVEHRTEFALLGSAGALAFFAVNAAFARPLDSYWFPVIALQASTMLAGGVIGVVLYRLLARFHDRRTGAFVGSVVVLATPIGFWASIPKRHVVTAALAALALYGFAVSREPDARGVVISHRALSYATVGLTAWVHAAEGLVLFVVLVVVDLLTARSNDLRPVAVVGAVLLLSLTPFLVTNAAIGGNPLEPPRLLPSPGDPSEFAATGPPSGGESTSPGSEGGSTSPGSEGDATSPGSGEGPVSPGSAVVAILRTVMRVAESAVLSILAAAAVVPERIQQLSSYVNQGMRSLSDEPSRAYHTFIRSGQLTVAEREGSPAINLTLLESTPILGVLLAVPVVIGRRLQTGELSPRECSPARRTDLFALGYVVVFSMLYLSRLPLHAQVTVRYLVPIVPVLAYFIGRVPSVRRVVGEHARALLWTTAGLVLVGGQLAVTALVFMDLSIGELLQFHAVLGLAIAGVTAAWVTVDTIRAEPSPRIGAAVMALPTAYGIYFVLLTGIEYLPYGDFALAIARIVSESIPIF